MTCTNPLRISSGMRFGSFDGFPCKPVPHRVIEQRTDRSDLLARDSKSAIALAEREITEALDCLNCYQVATADGTIKLAQR